MSKDNISLNDILEEFSPDGHKVDDIDATATNSEHTENIAKPSVEQPKTLEELELEQLQAISQGELSDSAINYSSYANKPNKIIQNPTQNTQDGYYSGGVVKISSRPDFKDRSSSTSTQKIVSDNQNDDTSNAPKKIDSRNSKAKLESGNLKKRNYARSHNEMTDEDFSSMSEKLQRAKAKRQLHIDEMNSMYRQKATTLENDAEIEDTPLEENVTPTTTDGEATETPTKDVKPKKKSIIQRIVDYYTVPVEEEEESPSTEVPSTEEDSVPVANPTELEEEEPTTEESSPKKKESFKSFIVDLFTSKDKKPPRKKESFKERMVDFFTVEDDSEEAPFEESTNISISSSTQTSSGEASELEETVLTESTTLGVEDEVSSLLNNLSTTEEPVEEPKAIEVPIEEPKAIEVPIEEPKAMEVPIEEPKAIEVPIEEPKAIEVPIEEPKAIEVPIEEPKAIEVPIEEPKAMEVPVEEPKAIEMPVEEPETEENPVEEFEAVDKKPNIFKRIKMYFLMEELQALEEDSAEDTESSELLEEDVQPAEETPAVQPVEETPKVQPVEEAPVVQPVEETPAVQPVEETPAVQPVEETPKVQPVEETPTVQPVEETVSDDDYMVPLDEDDSEDSIDIPIDEPITYKHFWQDPDFNFIDRVKLHWSNATERYRNRKRSGEIHIEIKSNPDTAILISDLKAKVLAEERLMKSREEYQRQVENGEYDDYTEDSQRVVDHEPVFTDAPSRDFTSYEDRAKVKEYISDMRNSLIVRMVITAVLCVLSLYITLSNDLGLPVPEVFDTSLSASGYLMVQTTLGLVAILTSIRSIASGIVKVFKRKADSDSFASVGIVLAFLSSGVAFLTSGDLVSEGALNVYMPIALLGVLANLFGKYLIVRREDNNFHYIGKDVSKFGLFCIQDDYDAEKVTRGLVEDYPVTTYKKKAHFTTDFIKYTYSYDMADRFSKFTVPIVCVVSLVVSLVSALVYRQSFSMNFLVGFVSIFSMLVSFCSCFSIPVCINSMLYNTSEKYAKREGAILGYQAVEDFYDTNSVIISSKDIFPKGSINISALKLFSNAKIDETLIYAISMANKMDSILAPTLLQMLDGRLDMLCEVENCSYEDGLGLCGWIDNKRILMGNRELMETHSIENLPTKSKELELVGSNRECVYISVSGNLALMLILEIVPNHHVKSNLMNLQENNIAIAVTSCDFMVSVNKISYLFGVDADGIKVIPYELFQETKEYFEDRPTCSTSIVTNGDIGTITELILATKKIHRKAIFSNMLNAVSCIVGVIIGVSFITMGGFRELTSTMILVYNLICTAIIMLICNNKNS